MFYNVPDIQFRSATSATSGYLYVWRPGAERPRTRGMPNRKHDWDPADEFMDYKIARESRRGSTSTTLFTVYVVLGTFGASTACSALFQYRASLASPDDITSTLLAISFFVFIGSTITGIYAHILERLSNLMLFYFTGHDRYFAVTIFTGITHFVASSAMAAGVYLLALAIYTPLCSTHRCSFNGFVIVISFLSVLFIVFTVGMMLAWNAGPFSKGPNEIVDDRLPEEHCTHGDSWNAAFFLRTYDYYGGALRFLMNEPISFTTLQAEVQTSLFMNLLMCYCRSGQWTASGTTETVQTCCLNFLRFAARWLPAAEELEKRSIGKFSEWDMSKRVTSLLLLEEILAVTRKIGATTEASLTPGAETRQSSLWVSYPSDTSPPHITIDMVERHEFRCSGRPLGQIGSLAEGNHALRPSNSRDTLSSDRIQLFGGAARRVEECEQDAIPLSPVTQSSGRSTPAPESISHLAVPPHDAVPRDGTPDPVSRSQLTAATHVAPTSRLTATNPPNTEDTLSGVSQRCAGDAGDSHTLGSREAALASASTEPTPQTLPSDFPEMDKVLEPCGAVSIMADTAGPREQEALTETEDCTASGSTSVAPGVHMTPPLTGEKSPRANYEKAA